jgi:nucleoside phosphorylase
MGKLLVLQVGMGPEQVLAALPTIDQAEPQEIWLLGVCGALVADLRAGDLVLSDATWVPNPTYAELERMPHCAPDRTVSQLRDLAYKQQRQLVIGPLLTSDRVLAAVEEKRAAAATGALAVEMEAGPLARWARDHSVPFSHLRIVLDPLDSALPRARDAQNEPGLARIIVDPTQWPALWRLVGHVRAARRALAQSVAALTHSSGPFGPEG